MTLPSIVVLAEAVADLQKRLGKLEKQKPRTIYVGGGGVSDHSRLSGDKETQHHIHAFGEIYTYDNAVATVLAAQDTWYQVTVFTANGVIHEMTPDFANNRIEVIHTGNYLCTCSISSFSAQANDYVFAQQPAWQVSL
jgi:hypothetical protein